MKKQYKRSSANKKKAVMIDVSSFRDVFFTLMVIFSLVSYQCMVPMSLAFADGGVSDDTTEEEVSEDNPEPSDAEKEDEDIEEEDPAPSDVEQEDEDIEEEDPAPSDVEQEDDDENSVDADVSKSEDIDKIVDDSALDSVEQNEDCGDVCPEIIVENINDTEVVVDASVDSNTGENEASNNGQVEDDIVDQPLAEDPVMCSSIDEQEIEKLQCNDIEDCIEAGLIECVEDPVLDGTEQVTQPSGVEQTTEQDDAQGTEDITHECAQTVNEEECNEEEQDCPVIGCPVAVVDDPALSDEDESGDGDEPCEGEECTQIDKGEIEDNLQGVVEDCLEDDSVVCNTQQNDNQEVTAEINTGDVQSVVNILNNINSNIVGENWTQLIYDIQGLYEEDINLFEYFVDLLENADDTSLNALLDIYNENTANITNTVIAGANTGNNTTNNNGGDVNIDTGDAIAGANVVNLVNQNLVGNNWVFAVINVFGLWTGDLIVPGVGLLEGGQDLGYSNVEIVNENNADIDNNATADVNTGNNIVESNGGDAIITTGDANASVDIVDIVNTNIVGSNWFFLMINNMGEWSGNILHGNGEGSGFQTVFSYAFDSVDGMFNLGSLNVHNNNSANIQNNVNVQANTGGNIANDNSGDANISTGDALAWANIFNFVNNNIVGNNWMFSVVNIMGEWTGDTVFAYPDLNVTIDDGKDVATVGERLQYSVTYQNAGEAAAEDVEVMMTLPKEVTYETDTSGKSPSGNGDNLVWNLGGIASGESKTFTVAAVINTDVTGQDVIKSVAGVHTDTAEVKLNNNYASDQTSVAVPEVAVNSIDANANTFMNNLKIHPNLALSRTSNIVGAVHSGDTVAHRVVMENTGDSPIYGIELTDEVKDATGATLLEYKWDEVGDLLAGEAIIVDYAIIINDDINPSEYSFQASAVGTDVLDDEVDSNKGSMMMAVAAMTYAQNDVQVDMGPHFIEQAQASDGGMVLGVQEQGDTSFWIWFVSLLLYALVINWTLFPKNKKFNLHIK